MVDDSLKLKVWEEAVALLQDAGYEASIRSDYSGRAMYGEKCPAIVTDAPGTVVGVMVVEASIGFEEAQAEPFVSFIPLRSDSMGRSQVFY